MIYGNETYVNATLPMPHDGSLYLDAKAAREFGETLSQKYCQAEPYPHVVIDNFLPTALIEEVLSIFPQDSHPQDKFYENDFVGLHKRQIQPEICEGSVRAIFHFFNSSPILQFLEGLTKIDALIGDPYFDGGGFHEISRGGKLGIHADFRINERLHLNRRINMLIYLNKDWEYEYGGELELWSRDMKVKRESIAPIFNRCVIFSTDADSYHGHPDPLNVPSEMTRRSIALYYYTASTKVYEENPAHSTMYVSRPHESKHVQIQAGKLRLYNYFKDWCPPIVFRAATKAREMIRR